MNQATKFPLRNLICAMAIGCASISANAATTDLGVASLLTPTPFQGTILGAGPFLDTFTFELPINTVSSGYSVLNFPLSIPGFGDFSTVFNALVLVKNPDGILFNLDDVEIKTVVVGGKENASMVAGPAEAGFYYLNVVGIANGSVGGLYSGAIEVTPVPEPEIWAMLLVGTGLVGFQLRRKSKAAEANRLTLA